MEKLSWDTNFFKRNVFKLETSDASKIENAKKNVPPGSLIYVFSDIELPEYGQYLMDRKLTFSEKVNLQKTYIFPTTIVDHAESSVSEKQLEDLAIASSVQSRFRVDQKINSELADELYRLWIKKALTEKEDHRVLTVIKDSDVAGMITLRLFSGFIRIDLIAVSKKYQGQGIGSDLIQSTFYLAQKLGKSEVQVTTQGDNKNACALYKKNGFAVIEQKFIYHIHT